MKMQDVSTAEHSEMLHLLALSEPNPEVGAAPRMRLSAGVAGCVGGQNRSTLSQWEVAVGARGRRPLQVFLSVQQSEPADQSNSQRQPTRELLSDRCHRLAATALINHQMPD